jgi:hypothetical protein
MYPPMLIFYIATKNNAGSFNVFAVKNTLDTMHLDQWEYAFMAAAIAVQLIQNTIIHKIENAVMLRILFFFHAMTHVTVGAHILFQGIDKKDESMIKVCTFYTVIGEYGKINSSLYYAFQSCRCVWDNGSNLVFPVIALGMIAVTSPEYQSLRHVCTAFAFSLAFSLSLMAFIQVATRSNMRSEDLNTLKISILLMGVLYMHFDSECISVTGMLLDAMSSDDNQKTIRELVPIYISFNTACHVCILICNSVSSRYIQSKDDIMRDWRIAIRYYVHMMRNQRDRFRYYGFMWYVIEMIVFSIAWLMRKVYYFCTEMSAHNRYYSCVRYAILLHMQLVSNCGNVIGWTIFMALLAPYVRWSLLEMWQKKDFHWTISLVLLAPYLLLYYTS